MTRPSPEAIRAWAESSTRASMKLEGRDMSDTENVNEVPAELMTIAGRLARTQLYALPRVITAEETKQGQWLAAKAKRMDVWWTGVCEGELLVDEETPMLNLYGADTIVLLADAPDTKDINVAKETVKGEYPDNPWFATVYEDGAHWAGTWRGTPVRPQSIRAGDLYDIHTAHGSSITGVLAARNGVRNPQNGDMYRLVIRKA